MVVRLSSLNQMAVEPSIAIPNHIFKERMTSLMSEIRLKASQPSAFHTGFAKPAAEEDEILNTAGASRWLAQLGPMRRQQRAEHQRSSSTSPYAKPRAQINPPPSCMTSRSSSTSSSRTVSCDLDATAGLLCHSPLSSPLSSPALTSCGDLFIESSPSATGASVESPETATCWHSSSRWFVQEEDVAAKLPASTLPAGWEMAPKEAPLCQHFQERVTLGPAEPRG